MRVTYEQKLVFLFIFSAVFFGVQLTTIESARDFSSGHRGNIQHLLDAGSDRVRLFVGDCTNVEDLVKAFRDLNVVFHFAANPEVRLELSDPETCFRQNVYATYLVLEQMRKSSAEKVVFASTSTVYGMQGLFARLRIMAFGAYFCLWCFEVGF